MDTSDKSIAAVILAGGRGTRLGNIDKGLKTYKGKTFIAWVIEAISPQVEKIILSINRNQDKYQEFSLATTIDSGDGDFNGPIAGILSCAEQLKHKEFAYLLIASCDSPNLSSGYVSRLYNGLIGSDAEVAVVNDGMRNQHLHCLIDTNAIKSLTAYYNNKGRSMHGWLQQLKLVEVDFSDQAECFININTQVELLEFEKK